MDEPVGVQFQVMGSRLANRYLRWGISGYPHVERRRLAIANLASFLAALSCSGYAVLFLASRLESIGVTGRIHVAEETRRAAEGHFEFEAAASKEI